MKKLGKLIDSYITTTNAESIGHDEVQDAFMTQEMFANGTLFTARDFEMDGSPDSQKTLCLNDCHEDNDCCSTKRGDGMVLELC